MIQVIDVSAEAYRARYEGVYVAGQPLLVAWVVIPRAATLAASCFGRQRRRIPQHEGQGASQQRHYYYAGAAVHSLWYVKVAGGTAFFIAQSRMRHLNARSD